MPINIKEIEEQISLKNNVKQNVKQIKWKLEDYLLSDKFILNNPKVINYLDNFIRERNITKKSYTYYLFVLWTITICLATGGLLLVITGVLDIRWLSVILVTYILDWMILYWIKELRDNK